MAELDTTRSYNDGEVLVESDLDAFLDDIETFLNTTKINDDNIQNNGITASTKLLNQSVTEAKLAANSVTTLKIADSNVTTAKIADSNVTTVKINDAAITTAKINDEAVTTAKLAADVVTNAKLADDAVDTENIVDAAIETALIADSAVTTVKINDNAITRVKVNPYYVTGTVATDASWAAAEAKTLANLAVTGRPVKITIHNGRIQLTAGGGARSATIVLEHSADNSSWSTLKTIATVFANTSEVTQHDFGMTLNTNPGSVTNSTGGGIIHVHTPSAGTAYYRLNVSVLSGGTLAIQTAIEALIEEL